MTSSRPSSLDLARHYIQEGLAIVPIPHGAKRPKIKEWQKLKITEASAHLYFSSDSETQQNIGVLLGQPSNDLIDVDLDCMEAVKLAPYFLPKPFVTFGRVSKPQSHYLYRSEIASAKYKAPDGKMLLELRSTGGQTVFPGSTHPSGEIIEWHNNEVTACIEPQRIANAVARLAACSLLAQAWTTAQGSRHDAALALAGGLMRAGWTLKETELFIINAAGAAGDSELRDRLQAVRDTFLKAGENSTGWPTVAQMIGDPATTRIRNFLNITAQDSDVSTIVASPDLPLIKINNRLPVEIANDALKALVTANEPPSIFVRSGRLTRVRFDENGKPLIESITHDSMREALGRAARFVIQGEKGFSTQYPPMNLVSDIRARAGWQGFPLLEAITETPTLRHDGSILDQPGYDTSTRLIYQPTQGFTMPSVPHSPTRDEVSQAIETLNDVLCDFPFADDASRANVFALLLTTIIRPLIDLAPLALIDAPQAGTGKGKLTDLVSIIATGRPASKGTLSFETEELNKNITAMLSAGSTFIVFDDVAQTLRSPVLASALTASEWTGRVLGRSEMIQVPQRATWIVTGNNLQLAGDIPRRCFWIRLDAKTSRPYLRDGFKHPNLEGYTRQNRGKLLAALLTLARAWHAAGCPNTSVTPLGSFEGWTTTIGGILDHAGITGFLANANDLYNQADDESEQWEAFLRVCFETLVDKSITVSDLAVAAARSPIIGMLPDQLSESISGKGDFKTLLGKALSKRDGRRFGDEGFYVTRAGKDPRTKNVRWQFNKDGVNQK